MSLLVRMFLYLQVHVCVCTVFCPLCSVSTVYLPFFDYDDGLSSAEEKKNIWLKDWTRVANGLKKKSRTLPLVEHYGQLVEHYRPRRF